jgi:hypothetical protein
MYYVVFILLTVNFIRSIGNYKNDVNHERVSVQAFVAGSTSVPLTCLMGASSTFTPVSTKGHIDHVSLIIVARCVHSLRP